MVFAGSFLEGRLFLTTRGLLLICNRMRIWPQGTDHSLERMFIDWLPQLFVSSEGCVTICNQRGLLDKLEFTSPKDCVSQRAPVSFYMGAVLKGFYRHLLLWNKIAASLLFFMFVHVDSSDCIIEPDGQSEMPTNKVSCLFGIFVGSDILWHWNMWHTSCQWLQARSYSYV